MPVQSEVITAAQMRAIESGAIASGQYSGTELMEAAGRAVVEAVMAEWPALFARQGGPTAHALVLCGPGNNGGDGFVVARLLAGMGWQVEVRMLGEAEQLPADARAAYDRWRAMGDVHPIRAGMPLRAALVVDGLFGIGLTRPVSGALREVLDALAGAQGKQSGVAGPRAVDHTVAIDIPSGLCADSGRVLGEDGGGRVAADLTVTFHLPKPGHLLAEGPSCCGRLVVADIGLQGGAAAGPALRQVRLAPRPKLQGHKYDHGHALILTGSAGHGGAARLAARAALRVGAGLVTMGCPGDAQAELAAPPDALMRRVVDDAAGLRRMLGDGRVGVACLGPGMGVDRAGALLPVALASGRNCVLDADALTALARGDAPFAMLHPGCVLTPHLGEFGRLFPDVAQRLAGPAASGPGFSRLDATRAAAARCGAVVVLKGPDTVIAAPDGDAVIHSAFDLPWLATAGAGDVLAGLIAGLLARRLAPLEAAAEAVALHAAAARHFGPGLIADDLPDLIPLVLRRPGREAG